MELLLHGLTYGVYLGAAMTILILGSLIYNPEIWLHDFPPDIREKYGPASERSIRQRKLFTLPFFLVFFGILGAAVLTLPGTLARTPTYFELAATIFVVFMVFNLVDLLIIDWLVGIILRPKFWILPRTEGMAGYEDYGFHLRGFLKGTIGGIVAAPVLAGIAYLAFIATGG